jgi:glycosyltransferase involved in cell wall biosynthesis
VKILLVHNFYGSAAPSGENQVFEAEKALLESRGHEVADFTRYSDEIRSQGVWGALRGALATAWNPWMVSAIRQKLSHFRPDVVHVHNTFPLISPAIFHAVGGAAARVLTLHNYRIFCPAAIPMRAGQVCTECIDRRSVWPAIRYGCYRHSRVATLPLAFGVGLHRALGTWHEEVDAFIALTIFQSERLCAAGLPADRLHVKPNFFPGKPAVRAWKDRAIYAVFVGRLSAEKGVRDLLRAWQLWGSCAPDLRLVGDGELRAELTRMAPELPVRFFGQIDAAAAQEQIAGARLLILPSVCFEGFPMVVREAFAFGTPVAVSDLGPLPTIVEHGGSGLVFPPGTPESIFRVVRAAWEEPGMLERLGRGARAAFEAQYTEETNYIRLMDIYQRAIQVSRSRVARVEQ